MAQPQPGIAQRVKRSLANVKQKMTRSSSVNGGASNFSASFLTIYEDPQRKVGNPADVYASEEERAKRKLGLSLAGQKSPKSSRSPKPAMPIKSLSFGADRRDRPKGSSKEDGARKEGVVTKILDKLGFVSTKSGPVSSPKTTSD